MQPSLHKLNVLLARLQTDMGVQETTPDGATDFCTVEDNFSLDYKQDFGPQALAQGILGQPQTVKGIASCDIKISLPVVPSLSTTPNVNDFLLCCGFKQTELAFPYIYKQSSDIVGECKDMTLWGYTGDKTAFSSLLTIISSAMFDCKIVGELGKALMFEFTGKGAVEDGQFPQADNYPTGMPLLSSIVPAVIKATTMTIGSISFKILKFDLTFGNKVELVKDMSKQYGNSQATITGREVKFTAQALQTSLGTASTNPIEKMDGQTLGDFSIIITHSIYSTITIGSASGMCSITGIKQAADAGLNVFDISGTFINNDTQISFYSP
jgi:hypothetical protein